MKHNLDVSNEIKGTFSYLERYLGEIDHNAFINISNNAHKYMCVCVCVRVCIICIVPK